MAEPLFGDEGGPEPPPSVDADVAAIRAGDRDTVPCRREALA
jgi:hypothetical protein